MRHIPHVHFSSCHKVAKWQETTEKAKKNEVEEGLARPAITTNPGGFGEPLAKDNRGLFAGLSDFDAFWQVNASAREASVSPMNEGRLVLFPDISRQRPTFPDSGDFGGGEFREISFTMRLRNAKVEIGGTWVGDEG
jgi:hypothetical protein